MALNVQLQSSEAISEVVIAARRAFEQMCMYGASLSRLKKGAKNPKERCVAEICQVVVRKIQ